MKLSTANHTKRLNFRVKKSQFLKLKSSAKSVNLPLSKFIRIKLFSDSKSVHNSLKTKQNNADFNDQLHRIERKYQGLGENLNQAMKQCYIYGLNNGENELLKQVNNAIKEVQHLDNDVQKLKR